MTSQRTKDLIPFAALSASYFAHVGFFNPYMPLWLKDLGLSLLAIGLINVFMGDKASQILGRRQKPSALGWVIYIVTFGIGIVLYQWLRSRLRDYGYGV